jgi:hypothetical protein
MLLPTLGYAAGLPMGICLYSLTLTSVCMKGNECIGFLLARYKVPGEYIILLLYKQYGRTPDT